MSNFVSILIPCYNGERWLGHAIESALTQSWPGREVIVFDDGSTDGSLDVIRSFSDRIRWEKGPNRGGNAARNYLLEMARGEWLQYLDADDYLLPEKISRQVDVLAALPSTDVVYSPVLVEHWSEAHTRHELFPLPEPPHDLWALLARWFLPQTGGCLWRRQAILDVGGWKVDQPCCQEHELYLRLLMAEKRFAFCDHAGAVYRLWSEQTVCRHDPAEVRRRRLEVEQRLEEFLRDRGELTRERLHAINLARFEIARCEWQSDEVFASELMEQVYRTEPGFVPGETPAAPSRYQRALRLLGFRRTEQLARWLRERTTRTGLSKPR